MSFVFLLLSVLNFVQVRMIQWQSNVAVKTCLNFSQRHFAKSGRRRHHCFIQFYCLLHCHQGEEMLRLWLGYQVWHSQDQIFYVKDQGVKMLCSCWLLLQWNQVAVRWACWLMQIILYVFPVSLNSLFFGLLSLRKGGIVWNQYMCMYSANGSTATEVLIIITINIIITQHIFGLTKNKKNDKFSKRC